MFQDYWKIKNAKFSSPFSLATRVFQAWKKYINGKIKKLIPSSGKSMLLHLMLHKIHYSNFNLALEFQSWTSMRKNLNLEFYLFKSEICNSVITGRKGQREWKSRRIIYLHEVRNATLTIIMLETCNQAKNLFFN
jgi:hypothetical protein